MPNRPLISIIDDDESVREATAGLMRSHGFAVEHFESALDFLSSPYVQDTRCLIADIHMPRMTGIELHRQLTKSGHAIPTILITAYPDDRDRARALADGVKCYLSKPFDENALLECIRTAIQGVKPKGDHS